MLTYSLTSFFGFETLQISIFCTFRDFEILFSKWFPFKEFFSIFLKINFSFEQKNKFAWILNWFYFCLWPILILKAWLLQIPFLELQITFSVWANFFFTCQKRKTKNCRITWTLCHESRSIGLNDAFELGGVDVRWGSSIYKSGFQSFF